MTDALQHANLLLQPLHLALLAGPAALLKLLDGKARARALLRRQIHRRKVAFPQLALDGELLLEAAGEGVGLRVAEDEAGRVDHTHLIPVLQFAALVAANVGVINVRAIAADVLDDGQGAAFLVLAEEEGVAVADGGVVDDEVAFRVPSEEIAAGGDALARLVVFVLVLLLLPVLSGHLLPAARGPELGLRNRTGAALFEYQWLAHAVQRDEVAPHAFGLFVVDFVSDRRRRDELRVWLRIGWRRGEAIDL